jgi:hypothetical protein
MRFDDDQSSPEPLLPLELPLELPLRRMPHTPRNEDEGDDPEICDRGHRVIVIDLV